jgi:hypothetical protein
MTGRQKSEISRKAARIKVKISKILYHTDMIDERRHNYAWVVNISEEASNTVAKLLCQALQVITLTPKEEEIFI